MSRVCIGIYDSWSSSKVSHNKRGIRGGKRHKYAYFYNEDGKIIRKRISVAESIKIRLQGLYKRKFFVCQVCQYKFLGLIKNKNDVPDCPMCN